MPDNPEVPDTGPQVDITKRYDVYCSRHNYQTTVYRNALLKGTAGLFAKGKFDVLSQFLELEHANGDRVYISRTGVVGFCEHGKTLGAEILPGHQQDIR